MMTALEKRYQVAIDKIGHARLLNLPEQIKELLKNTKDLKTKTFWDDDSFISYQNVLVFYFILMFQEEYI